jgi:Zn-dependent peptidase ImmA (M78 family)
VSFFPSGVPNYKLKHLVEREAQAFRQYLGFGPSERVDAFEIAGLLGIDIVHPHELECLSPEVARRLVTEDSDCWSGMTCYLPNGIVVALLNPTHSERRQQPTLMEEVAHVHLQHTTTSIAINAISGLQQRTYDPQQEKEAYSLGSAVLVPKCGLKELLDRGYSVEDIAEHYRVSAELAALRTNLHFWKRSRAQQQTRR